jgi:RimJ/RimL family protein N-acetyltransferase
MMAGMEHEVAPPDRPLNDGFVTLRVPAPSDIDAIAEYARREAGLDDTWLPYVPGPPAERGGLVVADWLRGWNGQPSHNGPALLLTIPATPEPVGMVMVGARAGGVELAVGVAPPWRGQGLATRALRLTATWLIRDRGIQEVELRISRDHAVSKRVAVRAGFDLAGTVRQVIEATSQGYDDLRYDFRPREGT